MIIIEWLAEYGPTVLSGVLAFIFGQYAAAARRKWEQPLREAEVQHLMSQVANETIEMFQAQIKHLKRDNIINQKKLRELGEQITYWQTEAKHWHDMYDQERKTVLAQSDIIRDMRTALETLREQLGLDKGEEDEA